MLERIMIGFFGALIIMAIISVIYMLVVGLFSLVMHYAVARIILIPFLILWIILCIVPIESK